MVMVTLIVSIYYNVIIGYSLYYMFASFQSPLPWAANFSGGGANCSSSSAGAFSHLILVIFGASSLLCSDAKKNKNKQQTNKK